MAKKTGRYGLTAAALAVGALVAAPAAGAQARTPHETTTSVPGTTVPLRSSNQNAAGVKGQGPNFAAHQQKLEQALALRIAQIQKLQQEAQSSTTLTQAHQQLLGSRLAGELATLQSLAQSVPNDTTGKELQAASQEMLQGNRVFAVMTPQVFETIEGDQLAAQVATLEKGLPGLQDAVTALAGDPGERAAQAHLTNYENRVAAAAKATSYAQGTVLFNVLAQQPANWPRDQHVFENANRVLLGVNISLAYASFDASEIGLLAGGATSGSVSSSTAASS